MTYDEARVAPVWLADSYCPEQCEVIGSYVIEYKEIVQLEVP